MYLRSSIFYIFSFLILKISVVLTTELTFELTDSAKECFYQDIQKNISATLEYQVVTGGKYDVDVILEDPYKEVLFKKIKSQFDSFTFHAKHTGIYVVCFSNEFSTFSHKLVYVDLQVGEEPALPGLEHITVMTQMESSVQDTHKALTTILDFQTHHRLREAQGRKRAEDLNERVLWWSVIETVVVITISIGQVLILRNFFTDKKPMNFR